MEKVDLSEFAVERIEPRHLIPRLIGFATSLT